MKQFTFTLRGGASSIALMSDAWAAVVITSLRQELSVFFTDAIGRQGFIPFRAIVHVAITVVVDEERAP